MPTLRQYNIFSLGLDAAMNRQSSLLSFIPEDTTTPVGALAMVIPSGIRAEDISAGEIPQTLFYAKQTFADTVSGMREGFDPSDGFYKWIIGNATNSVDFNVTTAGVLTVTGAISAATIDIGGADATSFHVDIDGNMWLGAATFAASGARISNAGVATLNSATITGTITATTLTANTAGTIGGLTISATALTAVSGGNTTIVSSGATAFTSGPTGAATTTITQAGVLTTTSAVIAAFTIASTTISATNLTLTSGAANVANITVGTGATAGGLNSANAAGDIVFWAGDTFANRATAPFRVEADGSVIATDATITGSITATSGAIGGFSIGSDYIRDAANSFGLASTVTGGDDVRFWAGDTFANRATADFRVTEAGAVTASSMTITGGSISSASISSIPNSTATDISLLTHSYNMAFSVTDADTIAWGAGTIALSNGRTFAIDAGNTGNMAALTYIYLDTAVSSTVLQTTTTYSTAIGANKLLVGMAQNNTVTASFIPFGGGQPLIDGGLIGALSIVAGNIAATTITAGKMNVSQLSAIAADLGSITAGTVTGGTIQTASSGDRFVMTSSTFRGIETGGNVVFEIILSGGDAGDVIMGDDATSQFAKWDDSAGTFSVNGTTLGFQTEFGDGSDGATTIGVDTTLTRDMYYTTLTVSAGFNLTTAGYRIFASTSVSVSGTIRRNGNAGGNGGNAGADAGGAAGAAASVLAAGTLGGAPAGTVGGVGETQSTGAGPDAGGTAAASTSIITTGGRAGSAGGDGGGLGGWPNPGGTAGAAGAATTGTSAALTNPRNTNLAIAMIDTGSSYSQLTAANAASGSGGGGRGGNDGGGVGGAGGGGGGSGGNAGVIIIASPTITVAVGGTVSANGGTGGSGGTGSAAASGNAGGGGGGGGAPGGAGGYVCLIYKSYTNSGTVSANGGTGGAVGTGGAGSGTGPSGSNGTVGSSGQTGTVITLQI